VKKVRLTHIILLISFALILLVGLQIKNAFQLYSQTVEEFETHIENILSKVAIRHEKASDFKRYTALFKNDISGQYKTALKQEFLDLLPVQEFVNISDTFIYNQGRKTKYLLIKGESYDSISGVTVNHSVLARDITELGQLIQLPDGGTLNLKDTNDLSFQLDKRAMNNLFKKSKYINDFMLGAFRSMGDVEPYQRVDLAFLDSVITNTLISEKLNTRYRYNVLDENKDIVIFPAYTDSYDLSLDTTESYSVRLFPGNIFDEELTLNIAFTAKRRLLFAEMWFTLLVSILLVLFIVAAFYILYRTIVNQKDLSEAKNDFISNMTHEFKTPISTISLACEALNDDSMIQTSPEGVKPFVQMISQENKRLGGLVERILQSAIIDKGQLRLRREELELNEIVEKVVQQFHLKVKERNGIIQFHPSSSKLPFYGDPIHTSNIISNLIDNAIKYCKAEPLITIHTQRKEKDCILTVTDNGIGIKNEHIDKIFDKLYRIPTGNIHDVKGFGLGLSYVKAITDLENWTIEVKSKYGEGSTFTLTIKNE
jgi:two-component system, OmpR family, phosphate regulon sensor histidine kinase PhoR